MKKFSISLFCSMLMFGCSHTSEQTQARVTPPEVPTETHNPGTPERGKWGWRVKSQSDREQEKREARAMRKAQNKLKK